MSEPTDNTNNNTEEDAAIAIDDQEAQNAVDPDDLSDDDSEDTMPALVGRNQEEEDSSSDEEGNIPPLVPNVHDSSDNDDDSSDDDLPRLVARHTSADDDANDSSSSDEEGPNVIRDQDDEDNSHDYTSENDDDEYNNYSDDDDDDDDDEGRSMNGMDFMEFVARSQADPITWNPTTRQGGGSEAEFRHMMMEMVRDFAQQVLEFDEGPPPEPVLKCPVCNFAHKEVIIPREPEEEPAPNQPPRPITRTIPNYRAPAQHHLSHGANMMFCQIECPVSFETCGPPVVGLPCGHLVSKETFQGLGGRMGEDAHKIPEPPSRSSRPSHYRAGDGMFEIGGFQGPAEANAALELFSRLTAMDMRSRQVRSAGLFGGDDDDEDDEEYAENAFRRMRQFRDRAAARRAVGSGSGRGGVGNPTFRRSDTRDYISDSDDDDDDDMPPLVERESDGNGNSSSDDEEEMMDRAFHYHSNSQIQHNHDDDDLSSDDDDSMPPLVQRRNITSSDDDSSSSSSDDNDIRALRPTNNSNVPPLIPNVSHASSSGSSDDGDFPPLINYHRPQEEPQGLHANGLAAVFFGTHHDSDSDLESMPPLVEHVTNRGGRDDDTSSSSSSSQSFPFHSATTNQHQLSSSSDDSSGDEAYYDAYYSGLYEEAN